MANFTDALHDWFGVRLCISGVQAVLVRKEFRACFLENGAGIKQQTGKGNHKRLPCIW
jgi:hypothetical protein